MGDETGGVGVVPHEGIRRLCEDARDYFAKGIHRPRKGKFLDGDACCLLTGAYLRHNDGSVIGDSDDSAGEVVVPWLQGRYGLHEHDIELLWQGFDGIRWLGNTECAAWKAGRAMAVELLGG